MVEKLSDWFPALNSHYHFLYYFSLGVESPNVVISSMNLTFLRLLKLGTKLLFKKNFISNVENDNIVPS